MRRRSVAEVLTGAVVLLVAAGFLAYAVAHSGRSGGFGLSRCTRSSTTSTGSASGADVRVAGVKVGSVTDGADRPEESSRRWCGFTVRDDIKLPKDSAAIITSESLLGGKYLSLQPGGDETMLQPVQTITITQGR